jgi:restriction endonuclease S subunit
MKTYKLGEVCELSKGKTITRATASEGEVPVIGGGLGPTYYHNIANRKPPVITISASGANAGFVNYWEMPIWASDCTTIVEKSGSPALIGYIYKYLQSRQDFINSELRRGSAQPHVYPSDIASLEIQLPSLEKQREVVEILNTAFSKIDVFEENLRQIDEKAELLLLSLLSASYTDSAKMPESKGTLTEQGNASVSVALKDFCKMYQPPTISTKEMIPSGEYVVYGANGPIGRYNKFNHEEPQLLVTCRGATCGAVNMSEPFAWINGNAMVIQPNLDLATLDYMKYAFLGGIDVSSSITGSAQPQITRTTLEVIKVPLPSLDRQREIVEKLDFVFTEIEVLRSRLKLKKDFVGALRQSLLSGAFNQEKEVA